MWGAKPGRRLVRPSCPQLSLEEVTLFDKGVWKELLRLHHTLLILDHSV